MHDSFVAGCVTIDGELCFCGIDYENVDIPGNTVLNTFKYHCNTCSHEFNQGKIKTDYNGKKYERCPKCGSWNYELTNISFGKSEGGTYTVIYNPPASETVTLFMSLDEREAVLVMNRVLNLKWTVFEKIMLTEQFPQQARMYLDKIPCLMNNFTP